MKINLLVISAFKTIEKHFVYSIVYKNPIEYCFNSIIDSYIRVIKQNNKWYLEYKLNPLQPESSYEIKDGCEDELRTVLRNFIETSNNLMGGTAIDLFEEDV